VTVPESEEVVVQVYVIVPDAPAARLRGLGLVLVREQTGDAPEKVPVLVAVGGLGLATMPFIVATEMFFTVITMRKLTPAAMAEVGVPEVSVVWKPVICRDCNIHDPGVLTVLVPALLKLVLAVKVARASRRVSVRSCVLFPAVTTTLKLKEDPLGMEAAHVVAV